MDEKYLRYNRDLVNRFINDYKLPIVMNGVKYFFYFLELYENEFQSLTNWKKLWDMIDNRFNGNENDFLKYFYDVREKVITDTANSESYQKFNTMDMNKFKVIDKPNVSSNNIYNGGNIGKGFLSIDLKKANFQSLKYVDSNIVLNSDTYEGFIGKFTDLEYIKESKYFRQVIFGQMNPKRHITVEKYLINQVCKIYKEVYNWGKIVSMSNDEIVIEMDLLRQLSYSKDQIRKLTDDIEHTIKVGLGLFVRVEYFTLNGFQMYSKDTVNPKTTFYVKTNLATLERKLMCVPAPYYALIYKLLNNIPLEEYDYHFIYEGIDCKFMDEFDLRKIK